MRRGGMWTGNTLVLLTAFLLASSASATDVSPLQASFASSAGDSNWNAAADITGDGVVGVADFNELRNSLGLPPSAARVAGGAAGAVGGGGPLIEILFPDTGLNEIAVTPGSPVTAQIRITAGPEGISSYAVSLRFDDDLDLDTASEFLPASFEFNLTNGFELLSESNGGTLGEIQSCEAAAFGDGAVDETFLACEIEFVANANLADDGEDLFVGLFAAGVDGIFASDGSDLAGVAVFANASVHPTPEPSAGLAAMAVAAALAVLRRRHSAR